MMSFLRRLRDDTQGSMAVEFALLGPTFLVMVFGVFQVGQAMQNYNSLRQLSADVSRWAVVQHQTGNILTDTQIRTYALTQGVGSPYLLTSDRLTVVVTTPTNQRVAGAREIEITVSYQIASYLEFANISAPWISYTRPIFVIV